MLSVEGVGWRGLIRVVVDGPEGRTEQEFYNHITDVGLNLVRDALQGAVADIQIRYIAVGTDDTATADGQTELGVEIFRKAVGTSADGLGAVLSEAVLEDAEAVGSIRELGWFAGAGATGAADSGVMIARVLYTHEKTNLQTIYIDRVDTIGRAA